MSRKHAPQHQAAEKPKKLMTPVEKFFFAVAIIIILYFILAKLGLPGVYRTDETKVVQHPHR
jgi:preprotein translocase subunit SecY